MNEFFAKGGAWVLFQLVLFVAVAAAIGWGGDEEVATPLLIVGIALAGAGAALALDAARRIRRDISALPAPVDGAPLLVSGSFGLVRHPIYGGLTVAALGLALARASISGVAAAVVLGVFFFLKSNREEVMLAEAYPAYGEYRGRVRRRMIPWLW